MSEDITTRLRRDCMSLIADEAADTIEQLRADVMCLKYQNAEFVRNLTMAQDERNAAAAERDDAQRELRKAETESSMLRVECGVIAKERDEARRDAERWEHDALRLMEERNTAERERDEARQQVARLLDVETGNRIAIANLTAERDALRLELWDLQRGFCNVASSRNKEITGSPRSHLQIARDKGWKCFEDEAYGPLED
jgi:chromosome segregation ATPase